MALTIRIKPSIELGGTYGLVRGDFDWDSSYPTGGEAFDLTGHGTIEDLIVFPNSGYEFQWDEANQKVLAYVRGAHAHDLLIKGGQIASTTNDIAYYATDILGKEQATDKTILGSASATKGGVLSAAAAALSEVADTTSLAAVVGVKFWALISE